MDLRWRMCGGDHEETQPPLTPGETHCAGTRKGPDLSGPLTHTQNRNAQAGCFDLSEAKA